MNITDEELEKLKLEAESIELQYGLSQTSETPVENKTIDIDYEEEVEEEIEEKTISITMYDGDEEFILLSELDDYTRLWNDRYCRNEDAYYCELENCYEFYEYVFYYYYVHTSLEISEINTSENFKLDDYVWTEIEDCFYIFENEDTKNEYFNKHNIKIDTFIHQDLVIDTVKQFYPEDYQFGIIKDFNFNSSIIDVLNSNKITYVLLLKFDNFEIKNGSHLKHNIKDLFVLIGFNKNSNLVGKIFGIRSSKTKTEYECYYEHSHLGSNNFRLSQFCLGSGQIVDTISKCISDFNELNFSSLLASIRYYIRWESLEGKPYRYIRNIKNKDSVPEIGGYSDTLLKLLFVHIDKLKIIKKESSFDIDIDSVNDFLNKIIINVYLKNKTDVISNYIKSYTVFKEDNNYYTISQINNAINFKSIELFTFKNDKVYSKIIDQKEDINIDYTKAYINPSLVYETTREFVKRINEYFLSKEI